MITGLYSDPRTLETVFRGNELAATLASLKLSQ